MYREREGDIGGVPISRADRVQPPFPVVSISRFIILNCRTRIKCLFPRQIGINIATIDLYRGFPTRGSNPSKDEVYLPNEPFHKPSCSLHMEHYSLRYTGHFAPLHGVQSILARVFQTSEANLCQSAKHGCIPYLPLIGIDEF